MTLTIVENFAPLRAILRRMAQGAGWQVVGEYAAAAEASKGIAEMRPALVLLDIQLDGGSSMDVLETVKRDLPTTLVAVVSSLDDEIFRRHYGEAGADAFFSKNSEMDALRGWLSRPQKSGDGF